MYPVKTIAFAVIKTAAKRNVIISAIQIVRLVYLCYRFFAIAKKQKLFEGKPKTWNKKKIAFALWGVMKPFGNPTIKTNVARSYGIAREDLSIIEYIVDRHYFQNLVQEDDTLIEVHKNERSFDGTRKKSKN